MYNKNQRAQSSFKLKLIIILSNPKVTSDIIH